MSSWWPWLAEPIWLLRVCSPSAVYGAALSRSPCSSAMSRGEEIPSASVAWKRRLRSAHSPTSVSWSMTATSSAARLRISGVCSVAARRIASGSSSLHTSWMSRISSYVNCLTMPPRCGSSWISPSVARSRSASRTGVVLTCSCLAISPCTRRVPPGSVPRRIALRSVSRTISCAVCRGAANRSSFVMTSPHRFYVASCKIPRFSVVTNVRAMAARLPSAHPRR